MKEYFNETVQTIIIFILMGIFTVSTYVSKTEEKINLRKKFNIFYVNTIAGWGIFSLVIGIDPWYDKYPQRVFTIMTVTYVGFNTLEWIRKKNLVGKLIEIFLKP